jgi:hypothetical protein
MVVKHNTWSFREFQGGEFRICYVNCGWSYSDVRFQVKKYSSTRKWLFFGPFISYWSEPISVGVINNLLPVTHRKLFYSEDKVDRDFLKVANHYYKWLEPSIELESPEDDEEELEFLVGYKPGEDLERNPILAPIRTPYI